MRLAKLALALCIALAPAGVKAACYDLSKSEPRSLTGALTRQVFPGPPNYEDVRQGDKPEPAYILTLPAPICLTGDEFADAKVLFSEAHLVATDKTAKAMRLLVNSRVVATLSQPMAAHTGHHRRPLVAWVSKIVRADSAR
jgi:hypothetical protein